MGPVKVGTEIGNYVIIKYGRVAIHELLRLKLVGELAILDASLHRSNIS